MEGPFDFNRTPISILGNKSIAYLDPSDRASWQPHGIDCWYTARCPMHYRQLEFFDPITAELTVLETQHSSLGARDASQSHRYAKCVNTYLAHGTLFLRYVKYRRV